MPAKHFLGIADESSKSQSACLPSPGPRYSSALKVLGCEVRLGHRMNPQAEPGNPPTAPAGAQKRRHTRHRFINRIYVSGKNGSWFRAMTFEISVGGLSLATIAEFSVGEKVKLSPVVGKEVYAAVRHRHGTMYGLEFLNPTAAMVEEIQQLCEGLPLFKSLYDP
jgi:hypothetical protein